MCLRTPPRSLKSAAAARLGEMMAPAAARPSVWATGGSEWLNSFPQGIGQFPQVATAHVACLLSRKLLLPCQAGVGLAGEVRSTIVQTRTYCHWAARASVALLGSGARQRVIVVAPRSHLSMYPRADVG